MGIIPKAIHKPSTIHEGRILLTIGIGGMGQKHSKGRIWFQDVLWYPNGIPEVPGGLKALCYVDMVKVVLHGVLLSGKQQQR